MDKLSLLVLLQGRIVALIDELQQATLPEHVTCTVRAYDGTPADSLDTVVVTDDLELACNLTGVRVVYLGGDEDLRAACGAIPAHVEELWPSDGTAAQYAYRFEQLVGRLKTRYDAWLYKEWLMSLIDSLPDIVWYKERSGLHNLVNLQFCKTVHKTREDVKDKGHCYIWNAPPESEYQCAETDNAVMSSGHLVVADEPVETDKGMRQFRTYKSPVHGRTGEIIGTVGLGHDVTDFTNMGMGLQILIDNLPYPVAIADTDWRLTTTNQRFCEAFGMSAEQAHGLDYRQWKSTLDTEVITRVDKRGERISVEDIVVDRDGTRFAYEVSEPAIIDYFDNVNGHYCLFRDVTVERAYERQTTAFANTDLLTGLANRRRFYQYLREHVGEPMTVLYFDLDNFKPVNDTYGHAKGDEVLEGIARLFARELTEGLLARQGGDEFAYALPGQYSEDEAKRVAEALHALIKDEFASLDVDLGCSVGIAQTQSLPENHEEFLRLADRRMYANKTQHHAAR